MVEYSAKISLMFPKNPKSGNGTLLVDIPNRGRVYAQALYNSPHDEPLGFLPMLQAPFVQ